MGVPLIKEFLAGDSKEIRDLANNEAALVGFLTLAKGIDDLPDMAIRFYEESRSLYQVTASGYSIQELIETLSEFFGPPAKPPGKGLPVSLRFEPTVKYLGGIRKDQVLFLNKLKTGAFYGALWPWTRDADKTEILLGFCSSSMSDADYSRLSTLVQKFISKKKIETVSGVGGQIHGISLPSFLQMSEMEEATYTLKVTSGERTGHLYLDGGSLIAAAFEGQTGNDAAYRIISWDNAAIQIEAADPDRVREIHDPLMHVMMESLKIKDESGIAPSPPQKAEKTPPVEPPGTKKELRSKKKPVKKVSRPAPQESAPPAAAPPPQPDPLVHVPFKKATDHSVGKQDQMSRTLKLLIVLGVVIVFAIVVTGGGKLLRKRQVNRRYDQLIADLTVTKALDAQIVLMMQYLKAYPEDAHRSELEGRLNEAYLEIEKRDYEKTILDVNRLPIDEKFEKKALSLYTAFLSKYPQSDYVDQINDAIGGIRQLLGTAYFEDLKKVAATDFLERYAAYREYLAQFPDGTEREAVERMIGDLAKEYYGLLEEQTGGCDDREDWDDCIDQCDRFLSAFSNDVFAEKVMALRTVLQDKKDVAALAARAALLADDIAGARKVYTDYLAERPATTQKEAVAGLIAALDADLARQAAWENAAAYAKNPVNDIFSRIKRLDMYLDNHPAGRYAVRARNLRSQLEPELQDAIRARREEAARRDLLARQQAEQAKRANEARRIKALEAQVARQLSPVASRFVDRRNGTFSDRVTGLTWCLLDSHLDLGKCITHREASAYVAELRTGGHSDWRLPTAGELATLYKNKPFFPGTGAAWYWTSESFVRGYHHVVDVVTSVPETEFKRVSENEDSCGAVRAVRR
ncbi:hypothetical protein DSCA_27420 [Desulfosarcina alkanivorans]|uniref:Uncharacterized protein n=1 Tax=Desulfosarcina alkanivorans TaxID=571177 RepID=A0A5K7YGS5_9BACT|nr:DUF1566 domain-containing protein [Desulfosarcina alkanivorans]BBO68812.1 hypothetical protein DSCA_27420 [Desulfosarcina alkanivorans]